jgi:Xaa-Pro dipeptidase
MPEKIGWQYEWDVPKFPPEEGTRRHRLIREQLGLRSLDCLIICGNSGNFRGYQLDVRWASNWASWFDPNYIVFPFQGEPLILTFSSGHAELAETIGFIKARPYKMTERMMDQPASIIDRIKELGLENSRIGICPTRWMPADVYMELLRRLPNAEFVDASDLIRQLRVIKSPIEQEFIRRAGLCADKGFEVMLGATKPGVKESLLATACESAMVDHGAELGPHLLIGSGSWETRSAAICLGGSQRVLKKGDIILNEITACYGGYSVQLCRPICIGKPPDDFIKLHEIHNGMYHIVVDLLKPGNIIADIELKGREYALKKDGKRFGDRWLWVLQSGEVSDASIYKINDELKPGMSFVVHPWTTDSGIRPGHKGGIISGHIIGDTYIITEKGNECVSKLPLELSII